MFNQLRFKLNSWTKETLESLAETLTQPIETEFFPKIQKIDRNNKIIHIDGGLLGTEICVSYWGYKGYNVNYTPGGIF